MRVPKPMTFDWTVLEEGLQRNNVGLGKITLSANIRIEKNRALLTSGQGFDLTSADQPAEWRSLLFSDGTVKMIP